MKKLIVFVVDVSDETIDRNDIMLTEIWEFAREQMHLPIDIRPKILVVISNAERLQIRNPLKNPIRGIMKKGGYNIKKGLKYGLQYCVNMLYKYPNQYQPYILCVTDIEKKQEITRWKKKVADARIIFREFLYSFTGKSTLSELLFRDFSVDIQTQEPTTYNGDLMEEEFDANENTKERGNQYFPKEIDLMPYWSEYVVKFGKYFIRYSMYAIEYIWVNILKKYPTQSLAGMFVVAVVIFELHFHYHSTNNYINIQIDEVKLEHEKEDLRDSIMFLTNLENYEPEITINMKFESVKNIQIQKHSDDCNDCNYLELEYILSDSISDYKLGFYDITSAPITEISARYLKRKIEELSEQYYFKGGIVVEIDGEADANPIADRRIRYLGEYGGINGELYLFKNTDEYKHMFKSQWSQDTEQDAVSYIGTNEELAFMRAYAFADFLRKEVDLFIVNKPGFQYTAKENIEYGGRYRKIIINIRFYGVYEKIKG